MADTPTMSELCADLLAEHEWIRSLVVDLDDAALDTPTPAEGWSIRDQLTHLAFFDEKAVLAAVDPEAFAADVEKAFSDFEAYEEEHLARGRSMSSHDLIVWWDGARSRLVDLFGNMDPKERLNWYGPPMSARSSATARFMETWAHGLDVADALGVSRRPTESIRHICDLGVRTLGFSFVVRGLEAPSAPVHVVLTSPAGETWEWGPDDASDTVSGPAEDFAMLVAQRRHRSDTAITTTGPVADEWMSIAQVYAGPPGPGRPAKGSQ